MSRAVVVAAAAVAAAGAAVGVDVVAGVVREMGSLTRVVLQWEY